MMVVVVIITLMASIALPGISRQMQNHRAKQAAESIGMVYRGARLRAMGRGSAVLVRYTASSGSFQTLEAIRGGADGCAQLPEASCLTKDRWKTPATYQSLKVVSFSGGDFALTPANSDGEVTNLDLCFSPSGRSYSRDAVDSLLSPMLSPISFDVTRNDGVGLKRSVIVTSSGSARTVAYE